MAHDAASAAGLPETPIDGLRRHRLLPVRAWIPAVAGTVAILDLLGVDVSGWFSELWDQIKEVPAGYIVAAVIAQSGQTVLAGLSYYGILKAAYPGEVQIAPIVTAYAVGVAMNGFLPANIGTFVTLIMFFAIIPSATVGGAIAAYLVQKIFFTLIGTLVYLYLFLSVPGTFDLNLGNLTEHPAAALVIVVGGGFLLFLLGRIFCRQVQSCGRRRSRAASSSPIPGGTSRTPSSRRSRRGAASFS